MKSQIKIGDLVYVPSEVTLFNESTTHKLDSPASLLITGEKNNNYEVSAETIIDVVKEVAGQSEQCLSNERKKC